MGLIRKWSYNIYTKQSAIFSTHHMFHKITCYDLSKIDMVFFTIYWCSNSPSAFPTCDCPIEAQQSHLLVRNNEFWEKLIICHFWVGWNTSATLRLSLLPRRPGEASRSRRCSCGWWSFHYLVSFSDHIEKVLSFPGQTVWWTCSGIVRNKSMRG